MYNIHSINFLLALQTLLLFLPSFLVGYLHLYLLRNCHKQNIQLLEEHWKDPENFDPTRFLSEDQNTIKYDEWLQPFGYGKYNSLEYTNYSTRCLRWDCKHLRKKQYTT